MNETKTKLAQSLSSDNIELIPFLPYLLQDLWELGANPKDIIELLEKYVHKVKTMKVLDLACGKGAVGIKLSKKLGVRVKGIDLIPEFIDYANKKACDIGVNELCQFIVGDINQSLNEERNYDIVVFAAAIDILGNPLEALNKLSSVISNNGYIIIDDGYSYDGEICPNRKEWLRYIEQAGMILVGEKTVNENDLIKTNCTNQDYIVNRAEELCLKYPDKTSMFRDYIDAQQAECDMLESEIVGVTLLLQKK